MASTYTQTDGGADGSQFFQDVAISPATLADGSLRQRLDTKVYPSKGIISDPAVGKASLTLAVTPTGTVVHATAITLTATIVTNSDEQATGQVQFYDGATPIGSPVTPVNNVATFVDNAGLTVGTHPLSAKYPGDNVTPALTSNVVSKVAS